MPYKQYPKLSINILEAAQLVTAAGSLVVACSALWLTVKTRNDDLDYREVSIRPILIFETSSFTGKMVIKNVGLGSAYIASVRYVVGGKEAFSKIDYRKDVYADSPDTSELKKGVISALINDKSYYNLNKNLPRLELFGNLPAAGDVIPADSEMTVYEINNLKLIENSLNSVGLSSFYYDWVSAMGMSSRGSFTIKYCSITNKWCNEAGED